MTVLNQSQARTTFEAHIRAPNSSSHSGIQFTADRIMTIFSISAFIPCIIAGNLLVITAVVKTRQLRTVTNIFVGSLAVTDVIVGAFSLPIYLAFIVKGQLWFSYNFPVMKPMWTGLDMITGVASIINLMNISIDRYICIHYPFRYSNLMSARKAILLASFSWLYGLFNYSFIKIPGLDRTSHILMVTILAYLIPLCVIILAYIRIARVAGKQAKKIKMLRKETKNTLASFLKEVKAARVLAVVVGAFVLCWSGTFIMNLKFGICQKCSRCQCGLPLAQIINLVKMLQYLSSVVNPFIYTSLNKDFRKAIRTLVLGSRGRRRRDTGQTVSARYTVRDSARSEEAKLYTDD